MKVEISGYTDSKGTDEYYQKLSEEHTRAVVSKLIENSISHDHM